MNELSCLLHKDRENILAFCEKYKDIYLYGCGHVGMMMKRYLEEENIPFIGFVVSDGERKKIHQWISLLQNYRKLIGRMNAA